MSNKFEKLIEFETAKLANEVGFDTPCWGFFDLKDEEESVISRIGDTFEEDLITIEVPEDSLILTPNMSEEDCETLLKVWLKQRSEL